MRNFLLTTIFIFGCALVFAQEDLLFGAWESHLPYQRGLSLTQSPNKIYYGSGGGILSIDKEDQSLEFISKVEGLSSLGIKILKYDSFSNALIVIYEDSNIDIMTEDGIINVADIKNNTGITGDKRINDVHFDTGIAYFATGFGVVSFNMQEMEFGFTTQMGMRVNGCTTLGDILYAATEDGIYILDTGTSVNFGDFGNWELLTGEYGLPEIYEADFIDSYAGEVYFISGRELFASKGKMFSNIFTIESGTKFQFISNDGPELMLGVRKESEFKSWIYHINEELSIVQGTDNCANFITNAVRDEQNRIWYSDEWNKFRYTSGINGDCIRFSAPSPYSDNVSEMEVKDGKLFVASGGVTEGFNFLLSRNGIYILDEGQWINVNESNTPAFRDAELLNCFTIATNPLNDELFIGSFYSGLMKVNLDIGNFELFNNDNSPIAGSNSLPEIEKISGLAFDQNNNLWISAYESDKPLIARTPEGTFHSFDINSSNRIGQITVDDFGYKWIQITGAGGGILVYDDNGTVKDPSDDRQRLLNTSNSSIKINTINCLEKDLNGDIWVGTANGPVVFECGPSVFDEFCIGSIRKVLEDSIAAELLVTEDIRCIAVDGANRKWFGSRNGIFVQSPDGRDKVHRFTIDNSPLFDNNIIDMAFDGESGIMYIATLKGIQAFRTLSSDGGRRHKTTAYAFPNPVRPGFDGIIAFKGLSRDARIKITDMSGRLVHETIALGGQASWNGRDYNGNPVASGVYLVFSNSRDQFEDPDTAVLKLLIVR